MKNKKIIILCITAIVLIITGLLYFSYGFYMTNITGTENSKKLTSITKIFKFEFSDGTEKLTSNNTSFIPGSVIEKTFTITNKSTEGVYFNIDLDEVTNSFSRTSDIVYEVYYNDNVISTNTFPTVDSSIATNLYIEKDGTKTYTLKVKYLNSDDNQISDMGKGISASIVFSRTDSPKTKFNILGNSYQEATPSPDSPSEIVSLGSKVTDESDTNYGKYKLQFEGIGKNSIDFDIANAFSGYYYDSGGLASSADKRFIRYRTVEVKPNTTYTLSSNLVIYTIWFFDDDVSISRSQASNSSKTKTFTTPGNCNNIKISLYNTSGTTDTVALEWLQLEVGSIATDYTEYVDSLKYDIYLDEPLRCIGDVCDYIDMVNKKVVRNIKEKTFDGTESWSTLDNRVMNYTLSETWKDDTSTNLLLAKSNYYVGYTWGSLYSNGKIGVSRSMAAIRIRPSSTLPTTDDWKTELATKYSAGNPLIVDYVTATPTEEEIALPDISELKDRTLFVTDGNLYSSKIEIE